MDKSMAKPVKIAVGIYLSLVLLACSSYLIFILIGSLQGNDMSNSVLDTDASLYQQQFSIFSRDNQ